MASKLTYSGGMNVGMRERIPSAVAGAALVAYGLTRRSLPGVIMAVAGSEMIYRGATGHCPVYGMLGLNTSKKGASPNAAVLHNESVQVKVSVTIDRPAKELYAFWRDFENLSRIMEHLDSVDDIGEGYSRWRAKGPAGTVIEWDAEIINEKPNELIAWKSLPGACVPNAGSVLFKKIDKGQTLVTVELDYAPPAGSLGAAVARIFGEEPGLQVEQDLTRFKEMMETGGAQGVKTVDTVQEASEESFPASDAPAWT